MLGGVCAIPDVELEEFTPPPQQGASGSECVFIPGDSVDTITHIPVSRDDFESCDLVQNLRMSGSGV